MSARRRPGTVRSPRGASSSSSTPRRDELVRGCIRNVPRSVKILDIRRAFYAVGGLINVESDRAQVMQTKSALVTRQVADDNLRNVCLLRLPIQQRTKRL
jgi:hypothetical protein